MARRSVPDGGPDPQGGTGPEGSPAHGPGTDAHGPGDRAASVPTSLGSTIQKRLVLRLASEDDYLTLGVPKDVLSLTSPPGRGVLDENEVQVAVLGGDPNVALQARELGKLRDAMTRLGIPQAPGVERLPDGFAL